MIPKIIHYCWFGKNPMPESVVECISSWKRNCPDYEIKRWDERNFNIKKAPLYVRQAYKKKAWAFVTDYVRLSCIYNYGGVYFDTDVELIKPLDNLIRYDGFFGFEDIRLKDGHYNIATGLGFGALKGSKIVKLLMEDYSNLRFLDDNNNIIFTPCPVLNSHIFKEIGFELDGKTQIKENIIALSPEYLCPIKWETKETNITDNTISIHHYDATWHKCFKKKRKSFFSIIKQTIRKILGDKIYYTIKRNIKRNASH